MYKEPDITNAVVYRFSIKNNKLDVFINRDIFVNFTDVAEVQLIDTKYANPVFVCSEEGLVREHAGRYYLWLRERDDEKAMDILRDEIRQIAQEKIDLYLDAIEKVKRDYKEFF